MPPKAKPIAGHLKLAGTLDKLTKILNDKGEAGKVIAVVTLSPKHLAWYGTSWPGDRIIFGQLNLSIGAKGTKQNGQIARYYDKPPRKFKHGVFVPAKKFGFESGWVSLVNIPASPELRTKTVTY